MANRWRLGQKARRSNLAGGVISIIGGKTRLTCADTTGPDYDCVAAIVAPGTNSTVTVVAMVAASSGPVLNGVWVDPINAIAEANDDADDPALDCAAGGEGTDVAAPTEPDNFDCTHHFVGPVATVRMGSGSVAPGGSITLPLDSLSIASPGVCAVTVDVRDDGEVGVTACTADPGGRFDIAGCNLNHAPNVVRLTAISLSGVTGSVQLADITYEASASAAWGHVSPLTVAAPTFADCSGSLIPVLAQDGSITIGGPCGDVNCNNVVDAVDCLFILQHVLGQGVCSDTCRLPPSPPSLYCPGADTQPNGGIDAVDALFCLQHVAGTRPSLQCSQ